VHWQDAHQWAQLCPAVGSGERWRSRRIAVREAHACGEPQVRPAQGPVFFGGAAPAKGLWLGHFNPSQASCSALHGRVTHANSATGLGKLLGSILEAYMGPPPPLPVS